MLQEPFCLLLWECLFLLSWGRRAPLSCRLSASRARPCPVHGCPPWAPSTRVPPRPVPGQPAQGTEAPRCPALWPLRPGCSEGSHPGAPLSPSPPPATCRGKAVVPEAAQAPRGGRPPHGTHQQAAGRAGPLTGVWGWSGLPPAGPQLGGSQRAPPGVHIHDVRPHRHHGRGLGLPSVAWRVGLLPQWEPGAWSSLHPALLMPGTGAAGVVPTCPLRTSLGQARGQQSEQPAS